jgi:hypothetical protein
MIATYGKSTSKSYWTCLQTGVIAAYATNGTHTGPFAEDCTSVATANTTPQPDTQAAQIGEVGNPTGTNGAEPESEYDQYDNWTKLT